MPSATATGTPPGNQDAVPGLPLDTKTDVEAVDSLLAAIRSRNLDALQALVEPTMVPCVVEQKGIAGPPACPPGVPEGTLLPVVALYCPEGRWAPVGQISEPLRTLFDGSPRLYAVFSHDPNFFFPGDPFPTPDTYVALSHVNAPLGNQAAVHLVHLRAGRIVALDLACVPGLKSRLPRGGFIIPPPP